MVAMDSTPSVPGAPLQKKPVSYANLAIGSLLTIFEVSTLGQPFEVTKTHMAVSWPPMEMVQMPA